MTDHVTVRPHTTIAPLHGPETEVFIVTQGLVAFQQWKDGRPFYLGVVGPGGVFGEYALVVRGVRPYEALALTETSFVAVPVAYISLDLVWMHVAQVLAGRVREQHERALGMRTRSVLQRLAWCIWELDRLHASAPTPESCERPTCPALSGLDFARMIGTSREAVSRGLVNLADRGWIERRSNGIVLREPDQLERFANRGCGVVSTDVVVLDRWQRHRRSLVVALLDARRHTSSQS